MASALGFPHVPSLELHWDFSLGNAMAVFYGQCIGISPCAFFGIALGLLIGECHGSVLWPVHWDFPMCLLWNCIGTSHWGMPWQCSMASALGFPHVPSLELHWDFSLGNAMAVFY